MRHWEREVSMRRKKTTTNYTGAIPKGTRIPNSTEENRKDIPNCQQQVTKLNEYASSSKAIDDPSVSASAVRSQPVPNALLERSIKKGGRSNLIWIGLISFDNQIR